MPDKEKKKRGRPTKYRDTYPKQAEKLCRLGAIDLDLADFFEVSEDTIYEWKNKHPEFSEALKRGKPTANERVKESLFNRAVGYSHPEEKVFCHQGEIITHQTTKHYPPDTAACFIWMKNRDPENWRDRHEITGANGERVFPTIVYGEVDPEKLRAEEPDSEA